jgi:homoserine kinase type II
MPFLPAPKVNKKDLQEYLNKYFDVGELLSYKMLENGIANTLYKLKTTKGDYVFKIAVRHNSKKLDFEVDLLNFLKKMPIPKIIKTNSGKDVFLYKGYRSFIYPFIKGDHTKKFTKEMLFEVGEFLAELHKQSKNFRHGAVRTKFYTEFFDERKRIIRENRDSSNTKIREAVRYIEKKIDMYKIPKGLPTGAIHADVKGDNTLFEKGHLSGVVDFDNAYMGILVYDLVCSIFWFSCQNKRFNLKYAKEIYSGYNSVRKLTLAEKKSLFTLLHNFCYSIILCNIDWWRKGKSPKIYPLFLIRDFLPAEKNFKIDEIDFNRIMFK